MGPAGIGKGFLAQSLGYAAIIAGYTARFVHADNFFRAMSQARVDNSVDRSFRSFLSPDLLIIDDLGLHRLTPQQSADLYQLIISHRRVSSFVVISNSALDRLANARYQIVIEGTSYRERPTPHQRLTDPKEVIDLKTKT